MSSNHATIATTTRDKALKGTERCLDVDNNALGKVCKGNALREIDQQMMAEVSKGETETEEEVKVVD